MNVDRVDAVGEIVEASLTSFVAETPDSRLYEAPPFGSVVRFVGEDDEIVYGVVAAVETGSIEPNRRAAAFWQSEDDLRKSQPQIFELLSTRFTAIIAAHRSGGVLRLRLPPRPPRVHGFIYECTPAEIREVTGDPAILRPMLEAPFPCGDDLVAALLRQGAPTQDDPRAFLVSAGKYLALLLRDDYPRLQAIIRKLE